MTRAVINTVCAVAGAMMALGGGTPAAARDIGRIFFTPEQRASLEKMRLAPPAPEPTPAAEKPAAGPVSLNGIVTRSSGHSTTWVNGKPSNDGGRPSGATARVSVDDTRRTVPLKVGETFEADTGERRDLLRGGSVRVKRAE